MIYICKRQHSYLNANANTEMEMPSFANNHRKCKTTFVKRHFYITMTAPL